MTEKIFEIPLSAEPQLFLINLVGKQYYFRVWWNDAISTWHLDILLSDKAPLINGIPLITGTDLLGQYEHLGIGGSLFVCSDTESPDDLPTFQNLGIDSKLYFST